MKIKILGNGGAISEGLPYNSFIFDDKHLIETPPDIMNSLFREKIDISKIESIYISHFHGDHYFGLPFLLLRLFFNSINKNINEILILGPKDIRKKSKEICFLAVGEKHPLNEWIETNIRFIELISTDNIQIDDKVILKPFPMFHYIETWGFVMYYENKAVFSYFADTIWNDELLEQIKLFPEVIIIDLNGEPTDPVKVHLSQEDIMIKALPVSKENIVFYGTHLKYQKEALNNILRYTYPGQEIVLGD